MKQKIPSLEIDRFPIWAWVLTAYCFIVQCGFYFATSFIMQKANGSIPSYIPKIPAIDDRIPLIPVFVIVYWYSYVFWIGATLRIAKTSKQHFTNWIIAFSISEFIGFLFFCFFPTTLDRYQEGLTVLATRDDFISRLLWFTYRNDGGDYGHNLFPSYHCMFSMSCYMGVRHKEKIPKWKRIYTFVEIILIFMSTLFTKQHYFMDVIGGVGISILCNVLVEKWNPGRHFRPRIMDNPDLQDLVGRKL